MIRLPKGFALAGWGFHRVLARVVFDVTIPHGVANNVSSKVLDGVMQRGCGGAA